MINLTQQKINALMTISHRFTRQFHPQYLHAPKTVQSEKIANIYADSRPLFLEIGAGKGKHALLFAAANAQSKLIAVERTAEKFAAFDKSYRADNLENLHIVHADAIAFCTHFIQPQSLDGVFLLYPNPEPHNKNQRWLNMPFFEFLLSRLKAGGQIVLASNIGEYIDEAADLLDEVWRLPFERRVIEPTSQRTHFEVKYLARGELCQELTITKPAAYRTRFDEMAAASL